MKPCMEDATLGIAKAIAAAAREKARLFRESKQAQLAVRTAADGLDHFASDLEAGFYNGLIGDLACEWKDITTLPDDHMEAIFWLKYREDVAPLNPPIAGQMGLLFFGRNKSWSSIYRATHWMLPRKPLQPKASHDGTGS